MDYAVQAAVPFVQALLPQIQIPPISGSASVPIMGPAQLDLTRFISVA